ncbi:hypothetical protein AB0424_23910 [Streptomyces sp. NPDC051180]|uniref:hypothetical protein n=1 Tax=Streptomyces sp. NPDC051180 TaxID=3155797 RepID=UPI00344B9A27
MILDPAQWDRFLSGEAYDPSACLQAEAFAARNSAELVGDRCVRLGSGTEGFRVTVRTIGQEPKEAIASAEAVVEPRCMFEAPDPPSEPTSTPTPPGEEGDDEEEASPIEGLVCSGDPWEIDPENPVLPDATDLFTVRLSE